MSEALMIAALATVAVVSAMLSFVAWWLLGRRPPTPDLDDRSDIDGDPAR